VLRSERNAVYDASQPDLDLKPVDHFLASVKDLFEHVLQGVQDSDLVGVAIRNEVNQTDKPIGISIRQRVQISRDVIWSVCKGVAVKFSIKCPRQFNYRGACG
jgi:hypothetical protein